MADNGGKPWHPEHGDGTVWSDGELDELAVQLRSEQRIAPYDEDCFRLCMDMSGDIWVIGGYGSAYWVDCEKHDMKIVWD